MDLAEMKPAPLAERDPPPSRRREPETVAHLVVGAAEPLRRRHALEAAPRPVSALDAAMILLEMIVEIMAGPVGDPVTEFSRDGAGVGRMAIGRHPLRGDHGDGSVTFGARQSRFLSLCRSQHAAL